MAIKKLKMRIKLLDEGDMDDENKTDEQTKEKQYIWFLLLPLLL